MTRKLVIVHTVAPLIGVFNKLGGELLPGVTLAHILDEPLLQRVRQRGGLAPEDASRLASHVALAEETGADAVLVSCSTVSPCVDEIHARVPVLKIDEAMIREAVAQGNRIGVVATNEATLKPTRQLLEAQARRAGKPVEIELVLADGAFDAFLKGDSATHDALVRQAVLDVSRRADVVVLAQASMARILDVIPENERPAPILSSPHLALGEVKRALGLPG